MNKAIYRGKNPSWKFKRFRFQPIGNQILTIHVIAAKIKADNMPDDVFGTSLALMFTKLFIDAFVNGWEVVQQLF